MSLQITLSPYTEARLEEEASKLGMAASEYARQLIERQFSPQAGEKSLWKTTTAEQWKREFRRMVESFRDLDLPPTEIEPLRRENLYEDRGI